MRTKNQFLIQEENGFSKLPSDKEHLEEKRQELYQFLLKNNEQTKNYHQQYKSDQDKKIQKIIQEYIGLIKIDQTQDKVDPRADPNLTRYMQLYKQVQAVQNLIDIRVNMLLEGDSGNGSNQDLETQQQPIHRFLLMQPNKFQCYPSKTVTKFKISHKSHSVSLPSNSGGQQIPSVNDNNMSYLNTQMGQSFLITP